jgi:hypothetical protein
LATGVPALTLGAAAGCVVAVGDAGAGVFTMAGTTPLVGVGALFTGAGTGPEAVEEGPLDYRVLLAGR